jgi:hypothetical protein
MPLASRGVCGRYRRASLQAARRLAGGSYRVLSRGVRAGLHRQQGLRKRLRWGTAAQSRSCHMPPHRAFGCFSLLILNDRAAPSYQLLDLSLAGLLLDLLFFMTDLLSFEVGTLVLSLGNCLPLVNQPHPTSLPLPRRRVIAQYLRAREAEARCDHVWIFEPGR